MTVYLYIFSRARGSATEGNAYHFSMFLYNEALVKTSLVTLSDRRQAVTDKLFKKILENKDSKLRNLLPHKMISIIISERHTSLIRFSRQTDFEIVLYLSMK